MSKNTQFRCPLCGDALHADEFNTRLSCIKQHSFDRAKEGYVNLLAVQHKNSKQPGDNDLMIRSRQRFLNASYYLNLADMIRETVNEIANETINKTTMNEAAEMLLDIGCGDGYYAQHIARECRIHIHGLDIAKKAVKLASKRVKTGVFSVASAYSLPYFDNSFQIMLSVFSSVAIDEVHRVLKPGGILIYAEPGEKHLFELASHIYAHVEPHRGSAAQLMKSDKLNLTSTRLLDDSITVKKEHILDLLTMTPYYWRATENVKTTLSRLPELITQLNVKIHTFQKIH